MGYRHIDDKSILKNTANTLEGGYAPTSAHLNTKRTISIFPLQVFLNSSMSYRSQSEGSARWTRPLLLRPSVFRLTQSSCPTPNWRARAARSRKWHT
jgi:hypothetical protein